MCCLISSQCKDLRAELIWQDFEGLERREKEGRQ